MAGQENYLYLTQEGYYDKAESNLLKLADLYYLNKKFGIGEDVDKNKVRHAQLFHNILCTDECELIDWVNKKIAGEIGDCNTSVKIKNLCGIYPNISNISDSADEHCEWSKVEW